MNMLKRFKLLLVAPFFLVVSGLSSPPLVLASCANPTSPAEAIQCGASNAAGVPVNANPGASLTTTISKIINLLSVVVGIAAVIMILVGGLRYTTSGGKEDAVKNAKNTILYALIGLFVVALGQVIVRFVLHKTI